MFVALNIGQEGRKLQFADQFNLTTIKNNTVYNAQILDTQNIPILQMRFSNDKHLLRLDKSIFKQHNFDSQTLSLNQNLYKNGLNQFNAFIVGIETMFLVDFVDHFKDYETEIMIENMKTKEYWFWSSSSLRDSSQYPFTIKIIGNVLVSVQIIIGMFLCSAIVALVIRISFLAFPIFEPKHDQNENASWMNLYIRLLERNNKKYYYLLAAFFLMLIFYSVVCYQGLDTAAMILFGKSIPFNLNRSFIIMVTVNEVLSFIFLRTRSSIYFAPKFIFLYQYIYLYYLQKTSYGFYELGLTILILMSLVTFLMFIYYYEIPALGWSRQCYYTPTETRPRCYYIGLFQISWIHDTPQIWTMFYSLCGRKYFERAQLTFVDRNHIQFHQIINDDEHLDIE